MTDYPRIIGLCGYKRSGKDSVAKMLAYYGYTRLGFADKLKQTAYDSDPYIEVSNGTYRRLKEIVDELGWEKAKEIPDVRRYLQRLGSEGVRHNIGDMTWIDLVIRQLKLSQETQRFVVSDVRFPNEADRIRDLGGVIYRTVRPGYGGDDSHTSEASIDLIVPDLVLEAKSLPLLGALAQHAVGAPFDPNIIAEWVAEIKGG